MKKIAIFGYGGFGREVKMLIDHINLKEEKYEFIGYFDDNNEQKSSHLVKGNITNLLNLDDNLSVVVAIGDPIIKELIVKKLQNNSNIDFPTLIHPSVLIGDNVEIGKGCIICAQNILTVDIQVGDFVTLNLQCTIGHDTMIKNYCSLMPNVNVSGEVILQECVYVGTGAKIINQKNINRCATIGAGAIVVKDVPDYAVVVGNPGKIIKYNSQV